jgi:hypothetical protein
MHPRLELFKVLAAMLAAFFLASTILAAQDADRTSGFWYLLVRRADRPEKNYYDLSRTARFLEPQLFSDELFRHLQSSPQHLGFDVITDSTVRYGVYQVWKVRAVGISDSMQSPASTRDSAYVLIYPRNPDWKFCARKYSVQTLTGGARKIVYTDFQDGKQYTLDLSPQWPRSWQIYEVEILNANALPEIWQVSKRSTELQR